MIFRSEFLCLCRVECDRRRTAKLIHPSSNGRSFGRTYILKTLSGQMGVTTFDDGKTQSFGPSVCWNRLSCSSVLHNPHLFSAVSRGSANSRDQAIKEALALQECLFREPSTGSPYRRSASGRRLPIAEPARLATARSRSGKQ